MPSGAFLDSGLLEAVVQAILKLFLKSGRENQENLLYKKSTVKDLKSKAYDK